MSGQVYETELQVKLHDTDAAGVLFFAHLLRHAHDAYETFMAGIGHDLPALLRAGRTLLPIVHAEADYHHPIRHGDALRIRLDVERLGASSFTLHYAFRDTAGTVLAEARTVHVQLARTGGPEPLVPALRAALAPFVARH